MTTSIKQQWRFYCVSLVLLAMGVVLLVKMLLIQVIDTDYGSGFLKRQGDKRTIRKEPIFAHRGMITDRRGVPLAISTPVVSIWIDPLHFQATDKELQQLGFLLEKTPESIVLKAAKFKDRRFVYIKKGISPYQADAIDALGIPGVYRKSVYRRYYPAGEVVANLIGYTDRDGVGIEGLEYAYNDWMAGVSGHKRIVQDLYRRTIKVLGQPEDPRPGNDLVLSIDLRLQYLAYKELKEAVSLHRAASGSIVILDNSTGEILAMASQPSFNPNDRSSMKLSDVKNRPLTDAFEPGSTNKPLSMLAVLEKGRLTPEDVIDTNPGFIKLGRKTLMDPRNYGELTLSRIITKSSQVGMSKLALTLEPMEIPLMLNRLGFGQFIGTGMPGEHGGFVPHDEHWNAIEQASLSYGYGLTVNAVQLAKAYAVIASEGKMYPVSLLKLEKPPVSRQVVDPLYASNVLDMLKTVVGGDGTGKRAKTGIYSVAGKTGTSHKVGAEGYAQSYVSIFAGMAPASDPEITVVVVIDDPKGRLYFGGEVAAPVFSKVASGSLRLLDVPPDKLSGTLQSMEARLAAREPLP